MVHQKKILLCLQLLVTSSLALPADLDSKHEKRSLPVSDPVNLVEKNVAETDKNLQSITNQSVNLVEKNVAEIDTNLESVTNKPQKESSSSENEAKTPPIASGRFLADFPNDEFKVKILDDTKPFDGKVSKSPGVEWIRLPSYSSETHIIKVPEPYIIRVPHVIVVRDPHFVVNGDHFGGTSHPESFHPFGEFPGITGTFPGGENIFDISQIYPSNPIEISQGFEGFPPISGASEIQGFPGFGDSSHGIELLQPEQIPTIGSAGQIDHETDSVIIDAFRNPKKEEKLLKEEKFLKEEEVLEGEKSSKEDKPLKKEKLHANDENETDPLTESSKIETASTEKKYEALQLK